VKIDFSKWDTWRLERVLEEIEVDIARWKREFHKKAPPGWYKQRREIIAILKERRRNKYK